MEQQPTLEQAVAVLREMYGETLEASYDDGKDAITQTLEERLKISRGQARELVDGLIEARTIRWQGGAAGVPSAEGSSVSIPLIAGMWHL
jgi:hypothetical protein